MPKADERGVALLMALLVLALLVALILEFDAEARREYREAAAFRDTFKARMLTRAAVQAARAVLQQDFFRDRQLGVAYDGPTDIWALPIKNYAIGDGLLSAQIEDEQGKLNINDFAATAGNDADKLKKIQRMKRLFELLQLGPDLVDAMVDWVDQDDRPEPAGAESLYYQSQKPPYRAANVPLETLGDLRLVKGFTPEIIDKLSRYVTVYPDAGQIPVNLNTADPLVIQSLDPRITQTMAMEIVQGRPYKTKVDLDRVGSFQQIGQAMRSDYEIRSDYFLARLMITVNETTKSAVAVLRRDRNRGESSVLYLRLS
ncbi:type II secretion system minor pseudopilin GspK [Nitrospira moscoviensis]|uniref:Putative General secretion pathway protein K n=1 Tax=Nitrospira moscoviensis TaxID=42253 RepID=A0A0K2GD56_NITMO|nr:type II secretion system minor pseudopilin GspK [Nitrospira moscoviensis]ALA58532.1 putative General secretion pathway protein K [Nitrospira moscoviensis]